MALMQEVVDDLFNKPHLTTRDAVGRHFTPSFEQRVNGEWSDFDAFVAHIDQFRRRVVRACVTVLDEFSDGERYAERHVIDLLTQQGERFVQEVYMFAERDADGRFRRIEEMTLPLGTSSNAEVADHA
ncbi:hypothetical protein PCA31118_00515 [Pandoraea captiosa]|jgi:hypothetical protein|uniref:SnoaL-like domain-containing protein n=1 Tax=Pandoraea captiosa TaxID=2508302 RepID=A0A5E4ZJW1_9BURK|nr:nuclear transport factor 2 family protein [Pandoraea captiosa]VVE61256.1 hypothetical protein PCA31118_00515 [Pandoraea captiosa]